ncbi:alcohol dehydrogenase [Achlya hypogyna]|uniref:Alcohol dehydrogenase n=1 Tax=Achlya hypogyna TaxID=1202772 RepID=A0A1V9YCM7_ACHHY|nr:alcohol dehydrogenase [Achlya hypogyna]
MATYRKIVCKKLSTDFRGATEIVTAPLATLKPGAGAVLVKNHFLGINASDINFTNGKYLPGVVPPFDVGFEAGVLYLSVLWLSMRVVGEVVEVGAGAKHLKRGDAVMYSLYGAFAEYIVVPVKFITKVPVLSPAVLPLNVCGLTASIALDVVGEMKQGEVVLVTAAAGATGLFAVQLAKLAGNTVIGTCSSKEKQEFLLGLGCDRAIDYTKEDVGAVLKKEFPRGVNLVFESVGGDMLETCVSNVARHGRIVVIGAISGYQDSSSWDGKAGGSGPLSTALLSKSASLRGFFLNHHIVHFGAHARKLGTLVHKGLLDPGVDPTPFHGLESVADAIEYMYARKNVGKLVVSVATTPDARL